MLEWYSVGVYSVNADTAWSCYKPFFGYGTLHPPQDPVDNVKCYECYALVPVEQSYPSVISLNTPTYAGLFLTEYYKMYFCCNECLEGFNKVVRG